MNTGTVCNLGQYAHWGFRYNVRHIHYVYRGSLYHGVVDIMCDILTVYTGTVHTWAVDIMCSLSTVYTGAVCMLGQCVHMGIVYTGVVCSLDNVYTRTMYTLGQ